jgi:hypothetical protein
MITCQDKENQNIQSLCLKNLTLRFWAISRSPPKLLSAFLSLLAFSPSLHAGSNAQELVRAEITSIEFKRAATDKREVMRVSLPELPQTFEIKGDTEWGTFPVLIKTRFPEMSLLYGRSVMVVSNRSATLNLRLKIGENRQLIKLIDPSGNTYEYHMLAFVTQQETVSLKSKKETKPITFGKNFLVLGPYYSFRKIEKSGSALENKSESVGTLAGARMIYRRRAFSKSTDLLPWSIRAFFDGMIHGGKSISDDSSLQGTPLWGDSRLTFDFLTAQNSRLEAGVGLSYYRPGLEQSSPGDIQHFFGLVFSARAAYSVTSWMMLFLGTNIATPASSSTEQSSLTTMPIEAFAAASFPTFKNQFLEFRFRYYEINTEGTVTNIGKFQRKEVYYGPELNWVFNF